MKKSIPCILAGMVFGLIILGLVLQGCGGAVGRSAVSGTVADMDGNVLIDAKVWVEGGPQTRSLITGVYRIEGVQGGWRTVRAEATFDGVRWVGRTMAEVLKNEPTMNIHIVMAPYDQTTTISGIVEDATRNRIRGARVFLTTRTLYPGDDTSAYDGPYGAIVAVTDGSGRYTMRDVPTNWNVTLAASKVGFHNRELEFTTERRSTTRNFTLQRSNLQDFALEPYLDSIESWTMPDVITRNDDQNAYKAVKAHVSAKYRETLMDQQQNQLTTRATPPGSLIETDLYFNALDLNDSRDIAGYGIYRATGVSDVLRAIDFVRDPYANFYSDTGIEITPNQNYRYAVSTVDVEFLDEFNQPDELAESGLSNVLIARPLGQLEATAPSQGASITGSPIFQWRSLSGADSYTVYVFDRFPTYPTEPYFERTVGAGTTSITGPSNLPSGRYYWVVLAGRVYESDRDGHPIRAAYSYSRIGQFTVR